jgi:hypothetical protein
MKHTGTYIQDPDPGSSDFLPVLLDPGWEKTVSGINFSDHISELLVTIFLVTNTSILCKFILADPDPGSVMEKSRSGIRGGKIVVQDPG